MAAAGGANAEEDSKNRSCDDSEDESENLEESPCGRWLKRREEVQQRDIPGVDAAFLAMDSEEGFEVVWNEVKFSERKNFKNQEGKIRDVFDSLTQLCYPNIVKFHHYWIDRERTRVIFITEYMSSGSLKQFLKRTKRLLPLPSWRRWCTQVLSALNYLHACSPPIVHGNLTCDTIFIQHNGLIKIGSVAPDAIHHHVKTCREKDLRNVHFVAPEYETRMSQTPAVDVYAFGMCALEMAALEIPPCEGNSQVTEEAISKAIESLENPLQKDFIKKCLCKDPADRPTIRELLFHPIIFEVHPLKLLSAHKIVSSSYQPDQLTDEALRSRYNHQEDVLAFVPLKDKKPGPRVNRTDAQKLELEKFLDDVRNGIYPLTAYATSHAPIVQNQEASAQETVESSSGTPEVQEVETRRIVNVMCNIKPQEQGPNYVMTILLKMDDRMNRQLSCEVLPENTPFGLSEELVFHGFISQEDREMVSNLIGDTLSRRHIPDLPQPAIGDCTNINVANVEVATLANANIAASNAANVNVPPANVNAPSANVNTPSSNANAPPANVNAPSSNVNNANINTSVGNVDTSKIPVTNANVTSSNISSGGPSANSTPSGGNTTFSKTALAGNSDSPAVSVGATTTMLQ